MKPQPNRLPADAARGFGGAAIDRSLPLTFRLNGRQISGFHGDTVLSALLASGVDTLGDHSDAPIGLTQSACPAIYPVGHSGDAAHALPMARTPAVDGADYVTAGARRTNPIARLLRPGRSLGRSLDQPHLLDEPWRSRAGTRETETDLVVIGGGVAGLSAALAAARSGLSVTLLEVSSIPGGHSGLFGTQEGEDAPEVSMARLREAAEAHDAIRIICHAHAYAIRPGLVRAHVVDLKGGKPVGRVIDLAARFIVIATGSRERLPLFAGNRLPGVIGTLDAYELATRYGIWPGQSALVATDSNFAYRLAMLASDAGITIPRIIDTRPGPASRFIEFSRAYGIIQASGTRIAAAESGRAAGTLSVTVEGGNAEPFITNRLVVCGGWQPDLTLWHIAGGASRWNKARHRLEAIGDLDTIALAGSAAGFFTRRACIQSGADAIDALLGRPRKPVEDVLIDPLYETPDAETAIASPVDGAPTYLDAGAEFLTRPQPRPRSWTNIFRRQKAGLTALSEAPQPLAINDVAAGVDLGLIPPEAAGLVAQERVALVALGAPEGAPSITADSPPPATEVPPFLSGRFGPEAQVVRIIPSEQRRFEPGTLIYDSADKKNPMQAIGVVLRPHGNAAMAIVARQAASNCFTVNLRDHSQAFPAKVALEEIAS